MADNPDIDGGANATTVAKAQLKSIVERIERLEEEKSAIADDIKDIYGEAKSQGFDKKTLREMIRLRKMSKEERDEREALRDLYGTSLGVFG